MSVLGEAVADHHDGRQPIDQLGATDLLVLVLYIIGMKPRSRLGHSLQIIWAHRRRRSHKEMIKEQNCVHKVEPDLVANAVLRLLGWLRRRLCPDIGPR